MPSATVSTIVKLLQPVLLRLVAQRPQLHHPSVRYRAAMCRAPALPCSPAAHTAPSEPTPRLATPAPGRASCRCLSANEACMSSKWSVHCSQSYLSLLLAMSRCVTCSQSGSSVYIRVQSNGEPLPGNATGRLLLVAYQHMMIPGNSGTRTPLQCRPTPPLLCHPQLKDC
jgi:hypothetical protein